MLAAFAHTVNNDDPISALTVGQRPEPEAKLGWSKVKVKAASVNHHDLFSLRGIGLSEKQCPMILGTDAAGVDEDGNEVIVHGLIASEGWRGDETLDPRRTLLSEKYDGGLAEYISVPKQNLVAKPEGMSWEVAASVGTAYLTAYAMLFGKANLVPGQLVVVQGAGGGVATATIQLASAAGLRVWAISRSEKKRARAIDLGAEEAFEPGARLPEKADVVIDNVGAATWSHSVNILRPGGQIIVCGATTGDAPERAELTKIFFRQLQVIGSTFGTKEQLEDMLKFMAAKGIEPVIDSTFPLEQADKALEKLASGDFYGKIVVKS